MARLNFPNPSMAFEGKVDQYGNIRLKRVFNLICVVHFTWATASVGLFCNSKRRSVKTLSICLTLIM